MNPQVLAALGAVFFAVALLTGSLIWYVVSQQSRRRIGQALQPSQHTTGILFERPQLSGQANPFWERMANALPNAHTYVRRRLELAGFAGNGPVVAYCLAEFLLPIALGVAPLLLFLGPKKILGAMAGAALGYMLPQLFVGYRTRGRQREIQNGLADALDLFVLCLEAGSSLDQAIVKASEELEVAYPALADQLRTVVTECRAGKPRLEAFRGFADRTKVEDVRALVGMLVQTDRFGTSIAQALRTHANVCRTKRRQRAEEKAAKVAVKLVFPLVFCLFPAFYVVMLGPAYIRFLQVFGAM